MRFIAFIASSLLVALLAGCGFHLRGEYQLPPQMKQVQIKTSHATSLVRELQYQLRESGSAVVNADVATASFQIDSEKITERVLSVDANGRAREYEMSLKVRFSISLQHDGQQWQSLIEKKEFEIKRDYLHDTTAVLAKSREKTALLADMYSDAARLILLQVQAVHQSRSQSNTKEPAAQ